MLVGNKARFAIETHINQYVIFEKHEWLYGRFLFYCNNLTIGDPKDDFVVLPACYGWLMEFLYYRIKHVIHDELFKLSKEKLWAIICEENEKACPFNLSDDFYINQCPYFRLSEIGSTSFDEFEVIFIKNSLGNERLLWKDYSSTEKVVNDFKLEPMEFENILLTFETEFKNYCSSNPILAKVDIGRILNWDALKKK